MKKIIILVVISGIIILSGCSLTGNDKLKCTSEDTTLNVTTKRTYEIEYKGNDVKKVKLTYDYYLDNTAMTVKTDDNTTDTSTNKTDNNMTNSTTTDNNDGKNTNDTQDEDNSAIGGVVGNTIDDIIDGVVDATLDITGIRNRHNTLQSNYGNTTGFTTKVDYDDEDHYKVIYEVDYDKISDADLTNLGLDRSLDVVKNNYTNQGLSCQ